MVDTVRTLSALQALLADNTAGDISAQDARDVLVSVRAWAYGFEEGADDIVWDPIADKVGDGTLLAISGTQTLTEQFGSLEVLFSGQGDGDVGGLLYAHTFSTGDKFVVPVRYMPDDLPGTNLTACGLVFADGTASSSNCVTAFIHTAGGATGRKLGVFSGTLGAVFTNEHLLFDGNSAVPGPVYCALEYVASNTFQGHFGPGWEATIDFGAADESYTMTPTHVGVWWTKNNTAGIASAQFGAVRKIA